MSRSAARQTPPTALPHAGALRHSRTQIGGESPAARDGGRPIAFSTARKLAAETLGTGALVCAVIGSGIMAEALTEDTALALLANTIATGAILVVLITSLGPVSGAHFNPAVTLAFAARREIPPGPAALYVGFQLLGGVAGAILAHGMFELPLLQASATIRTGPAQWLAEGVAAFGLMAAILCGLRFRPDAVPWLVGLHITSAYWFTASTSFANPAVTLARAFTDTFSGIRPGDAPAFMLAQCAGALIAAGVMGWLLGPAPAAGAGGGRADAAPKGGAGRGASRSTG